MSVLVDKWKGEKRGVRGKNEIREEEGEHVREGGGKRKESVSGRDKERGRKACQGGRREDEGECVRKR